ncbi:MAG: 16S rRNA (cytidine(1402)-2'-O)-methyltransferase [Oscillospiraceae bacterium]|nr:16S rRNA (cytidine(1402)-2'-O)-methyltransferase [Oscillospiraceae bacterium]MDD7469859.1 16S rRNA (cytidine(1402)-2'-O)-methyltransferase [Oscillospiraceae bacterium]MDY2678585.1 16S rRNA (cytidine(1402)-2'-O)-methyltransferase [Oscillospiraceae bacterium]
MTGTLFVVGTPIGNLGDFSPRAVETLSSCDFIAAEDTRVTIKLLNHFGIKKPMMSYYEHNRAERGEKILERLLNGENCALVSDAGMPIISDPGEDLTALCYENNIPIKAVPGPCAFVTALAISGMPAGRFTFEGFLTRAKPNRREHLLSLVDEKRTMVFYEAPHKLPATLKDMAEYFGDRSIAIVKEITKIYESVERTTLFEAAKKYDGANLKGEYVLIVSGKPEEKETAPTLFDAVEKARGLVLGGASVNEAAKEAAKLTGIKKSDIYKSLQSEG